MTLYTNNYAIGDQVVPTAANLAGHGTVPTLGTVATVDGSGPVVKAVSVSGRAGQMISVTGDVGDSQSHYWTDGSGALAGRTVDEIMISAATLPVTAPHVFRRNRSDATTTASGYKNIVDTGGVIRVQTGSGTGILSLNGGAKPADGRYFVEVLYVVNPTTPASGSIQARLLAADGVTVIGSPSAVTPANLGAVALGFAAHVKPDNAAAVAGFLSGAPTWETGATAFAGPPVSSNAAPVATITSGTPATATQNDTVPLRGTVTDSDGTATGAWSFSAFPSTLAAAPTITSPTSLTAASFVPLVAGTYTVRLTATDNSGGTHVVTKNIVVSLAGSAPITTTPKGNRLTWNGTAWVA